ncbi:MAG: ABC transporter permease [Gemmatimonadetes bacterium]|nr:ABC transporter permease [Gemmatimonadota bacterium]
MLKGFWKLTWVETKVFVREPMGVVGTLIIPVILFLMLGRTFRLGGQTVTTTAPFNVAILAALFIAVGAVLSLVAIISIYREGGILKRLRATPLSPVTILGSHVFVKLVFTALGLGLLIFAGRQSFPGAMQVDVVSFTGAVLLGTLSILSLGFLLASIVPTARFAQPIGAAVLYPMVALSGLFYPIDRFPRGLQYVANVLPTTHAVQLMEGVWNGSGWLAHGGNVMALIAIFLVCVGISTKVFRWE